MAYGDEHEDADWRRAPNRQPQRFQQSPKNDFKIKVELPSYSGMLDTEAFLEWLDAVEKYFKVVQVPDNQKVAYVAYRLEGSAGV